MTDQEEISVMVEGLKAALSRSEARGKELAEQNAKTESQLASSKVELQAANARFEELQNNLARLEELKSESYQRLISDMFSIPARKASRQTVAWALVSIIVTVLLTFGATYWSLNESAEQYRIMVQDLVKNQSRAEEVNRARMARLSNGLDSMQAGINTYLSSDKYFAEQVTQVYSVISAEALNFTRYQTLGDIARMYKVSGIARLSPVSPIVFGRALSRYGTSAELVEQAKKSLPIWDNEALLLYTSWFNALASQNQARTAAPSELKWAQYAHPSDHTNYGNWQWTISAAPVNQVRDLVAARLDAARRQMSVHTTSYKANIEGQAKPQPKRERKGA